MPHETLLKFNYPNTLLREYQHWAVLLRPKQVTVGSLVLICTEDAGAFLISLLVRSRKCKPSPATSKRR